MDETEVTAFRFFCSSQELRIKSFWVFESLCFDNLAHPESEDVMPCGTWAQFHTSILRADKEDKFSKRLECMSTGHFASDGEIILEWAVEDCFQHLEQVSHMSHYDPKVTIQCCTWVLPGSAECLWNTSKKHFPVLSQSPMLSQSITSPALNQGHSVWIILEHFGAFWSKHGSICGARQHYSGQLLSQWRRHSADPVPISRASSWMTALVMGYPSFGVSVSYSHTLLSVSWKVPL